MDVKVEILQRIDNLPLEAQRTLLESLDALTGTRPKGKPGSAMLAYPGRLDDESAAEMIAAIEEGCGTVVPTGVNRTMSAERLARITIEESKCGGRPCVRGLRIRVSDILSLIAARGSFDEILTDYPSLEHEDILTAVEYAARLADHSVLTTH